MNIQHSGWHPIPTYDALEVKPRYAVFFFPAVQTGESALPEEIKTTRELASRDCTHWHPIQDPSIINANNPPQPNTNSSREQLNAKQMTVLALLANGKADFHAIVKAGANLAIMSTLVKAGLAKASPADGIKKWEITDSGMTIHMQREIQHPQQTDPHVNI